MNSPSRPARRAAHHLRCLHGAGRTGSTARCDLEPSAALSGAAASEAEAGTPRKPVCLVVGAGAGVGQAVARRFASEGFHVCAVRRGGGRFVWRAPSAGTDAGTGAGAGTADDAAAAKSRIAFAEFVQSIVDDGGTAQPFFADGASPVHLYI